MTYKTVGQIHRLSPALDAVVAPDAQIQQLAEGFVWAEGPVWVRDGGYLVFSDVPGNVMYRWSEADGVSEVLNPSGYAGPPTDAFAEPGQNGMALDAAGHLLACDHGNRALARIDLKTREKTFSSTGIRASGSTARTTWRWPGPARSISPIRPTA
jgi:gluconolactonase